jgi:hypothetical protein
MAEEEWFGTRVTHRYFRGLIAIVAGVFLTTSGIIGYDTGRRWSTAAIPEQTRWMGHVLWEEIAFGLVILGLGVFDYWRIWRARRTN